MLSEQLLSLAAQFQTQLFDDLFCYLILRLENIRELTVVLSAPQLRAFCYVHQVCLNDEGITVLEDFARQHGSHAKLLPDLLGVNILALVAKDSSPRYDSQLAQLRKTINNIFGDAVREILHVWIIARVHERQDGD